MTCGTLQPSLEAGVARPDACGTSSLFLRFIDGTSMPIHAGIPTAQAWMTVWNGVPAYSVKHTDRHPRPLERSP